MNNQDFEQVKAVLAEKGIEMVPVGGLHVFQFKKKDIWDGVEYGLCIKDNHRQFKKGVIYRRVEGVSIDQVNCFYHKHCKGSFFLDSGGTRLAFRPSTEQAYIDQLKKEAFERFGEIKDGDRFDWFELGYGKDPVTFLQRNNKEWYYNKQEDSLVKGGFVIYKAGKWATKLPKRIDVKWDGGNVQDKSFYFLYDQETQQVMINRGLSKIGEFLAKQLEAYLNGEI